MVLNTIDTETFFSLLGFFLVVLLGGVLVAAEFALITLRYNTKDPSQLEGLRKNRSIARVLDRSKDLAQTIRIVLITAVLAAGVLLFFVGEEFRLDIYGMWSVFVVGLLFLCIVAYLFPRYLGIEHAETTLSIASPLLLLLHWVFLPILLLCQYFLRMVFHVFRKKFRTELDLLDAEVQIRAFGDADSVLSSQTRKIISNTLKMHELEASDVLVPRKQIIYLNVEDGVKQNIEKAKQYSHTRFPLCEGDLDNCIGFVHIKDLFRYKGDIETVDLRQIKRNILHFPLSASLESILQGLLRSKSHMALVVDEFGGVVGGITLESLLEELVGEIQDEFDKEEELIHKLNRHTYRVSGLMPLHDLAEELNVCIDNEEVSTFGGLLTTELGRIPEKNEKLSLAGMQVCVDEVDATRILYATIQLPEDEKK